MGKKDEYQELLSVLNKFFVEDSPVNKALGIKITAVDSGKPQLQFEMKDDLVGWIHKPMLHGGIIASVLDSVGGVTVYLDITGKMKGGSPQEKMGKYLEKYKLSTIDLRIDYLGPGKGKVFTASGSILRTGSKLGVARMELHNDKQQLIAVGTGTYIVA